MEVNDWVIIVSNPNDEVRDAILRFLHQRHSKARGPKAVGARVRDIQSEMRKLGFKQTQTTSNLDYLVQKGWVRDTITPRFYTTPKGTTRQSESVSYKISDLGIDKLEGGSTYYRTGDYSNINIVNVKGVTVIGEGNIVNAELTDLSRALEELELAVRESSILKDEEKLDLLANLGSLRSQMSTPKPKTGLIRKIWGGIEKAVTAAGFAELAARVSTMIAGLG